MLSSVAVAPPSPGASLLWYKLSYWLTPSPSKASQRGAHGNLIYQELFICRQDLVVSCSFTVSFMYYWSTIIWSFYADTYQKFLFRNRFINFFILVSSMQKWNYLKLFCTFTSRMTFGRILFYFIISYWNRILLNKCNETYLI